MARTAATQTITNKEPRTAFAGRDEEILTRAVSQQGHKRTAGHVRARGIRQKKTPKPTAEHLDGQVASPAPGEAFADLPAQPAFLDEADGPQQLVHVGLPVHADLPHEAGAQDGLADLVEVGVELGRGRLGELVLVEALDPLAGAHVGQADHADPDLEAWGTQGVRGQGS